MPNYQSPGVYIEEISKGPKPIAGAPTNVAAIVGRTERGPVLEPTRLTSWNDYLALFGGYAGESYTADAVFGFFANGGTALWVVRADNASISSWRVLDGSGNESFKIEARSPGAWAAGLRVGISRESAGVRGSLYASTLTGPPGPVALNGGATVTVGVGSTIGVRTGMTLLFADADTGATAIRGTVVSVGTNQITVTIAGSGTNDVEIGRDARVFARYDNGAAAFTLASGGGFVGGDLIVARTPQGAIAEATVDRVSPELVGGPTLMLTTPFGADVPGLSLVERTYDLVVQRTVSTRYAQLANLSLPSGVVSSETDIFRLFSAEGVEAPYDAGNTRWDFGAATPAGPVTVSIRATLQPYVETLSPPIDVPASATAAQLATALGRFSYLPENSQLTLVPTTGPNQTATRTATAWTISATTGGTFVEARVVAQATVPLVVTGPVAPREGDWVEFSGGNRAQIRPDGVATPAGLPTGSYLIRFVSDPGGVGGTRWGLRAWQPTSFEPMRFGIRAAMVSEGVETEAEEFHGLSLNRNHPNYYFREGVVNELSRLVRVTERTSAAAIARASYPAQLAVATTGAPGTLDPERFRLAFERLERVQEPALLAAPDALQLTDPIDQLAALNTMVAHAEGFRRFAVVDAPRFRDDPSLDDDLLNWRLDTIASTYAAVYAPFVKIVNPRPNAIERTVDRPPSGFVMGVFARTDVERGVWKAPANEQVRSAVGLSIEFSQRRQDLLNPGGVNLLRAFRGRGIRVWGARNATDDVQWRYVNVRRLFLFLETSIERSTQWVVFEPNNETTWLRVRVSVENFLNGIWRQGGLAGTSPEQAYRVRAGLGQTMTETDIDLGYLIIEVAVAPTKPAEFVVFQISHKRLTE